MDVTYDPDDQFYQAFRAGFLRSKKERQIPDEALEGGIWALYISWLYESPSSGELT